MELCCYFSFIACVVLSPADLWTLCRIHFVGSFTHKWVVSHYIWPGGISCYSLSVFACIARQCLILVIEILVCLCSRPCWKPRSWRTIFRLPPFLRRSLPWCPPLPPSSCPGWTATACRPACRPACSKGEPSSSLISRWPILLQCKWSWLHWFCVLDP